MDADVQQIAAAITALRAALAAPTITYGPPAERAESWPNAPWNPIPPAAPQGEPVKGAVWYDGAVSLLGGENEDAFCAVRGAQRLYLHPPAAPSVPAYLLNVVEQILDDGHLHTQTLAQLRAAYESAEPAAPSGEEEVALLVWWLTAPSDKGA